MTFLRNRSLLYENYILFFIIFTFKTFIFKSFIKCDALPVITTRSDYNKPDTDRRKHFKVMFITFYDRCDRCHYLLIKSKSLIKNKSKTNITYKLSYCLPFLEARYKSILKFIKHSVQVVLKFILKFHFKE